jgi:hypothetical protein
VDSTGEALDRLLNLAGETVAREILIWVSRPAVLAEFERVAAQRLVVRMREAQEPRHVIRDRLVLRGISRATTYRIIVQAHIAPPVNSLTPGGAVRREPATVALPTTDPPEQT